jgi:tetratricopeptide (TPR) repeat protein
VPGNFKNILRCIGLSLSLGLASVNAQILHDTTALGMVREDVDYIYNLQFNSAREVYEKIIRLYPEHPIVFLLKGILQEEKYHDNKQAQQYYKTGITGISPFGEYGSEFAAYAYFGLSRISEANGE